MAHASNTCSLRSMQCTVMYRNTVNSTYWLVKRLLLKYISIRIFVYTYIRTFAGSYYSTSCVSDELGNVDMNDGLICKQLILLFPHISPTYTSTG